MNSFRSSTHSQAVVAADRESIWAALTDPVLLPKLTPLLTRIDADGDLWRWHLIRISALGVGLSPIFTERMSFVPDKRIDFTHEAPSGVKEFAGVEGTYELSDATGGTLLSIDLTMTVELPLPRAASPAVKGVIGATMARTGDRFSHNLLVHLGID